MSDLIALIRNEVERAVRSRFTKQYGTVSSYDPTNHTAKVMVQPAGYETGWVRVSEGHIGNGWGIVSGLQVGDQVTLSPVDGDINALEITGRTHSDQDKPPTAQSGEIVIQHTSGAMIKMAANGDVTHHSAGNINITSSGIVNING
jgi:phage baseplate assembly protein gpV